MKRSLSKTGVYFIYNRVSGKRYVGSAATSFKARFAVHRSTLRSGTHDNQYLQRTWDKYGEDVFAFVIVQVCPPEKCIQAEQEWIDRIDATNRDKGYNLAPTAGSMLGFTHSEEERARISENTKKGMAEPGVRERFLESVRKRMEDPDLSRRASEKTRLAWQDPVKRVRLLEGNRKGADKRRIREKRIILKRESPEFSEQQSRNALSQWEDPETRTRMIAGMSKPRSPQSRKKMSESKKALWSDPVWKAKVLAKRKATILKKKG